MATPPDKSDSIERILAEAQEDVYEQATSLDQVLDLAESDVDQSEEAVQTAAAKAAAANVRRMGKDRSVIAWTIIFTYAVAIAAMMWYIGFSIPGCDPTKGDAAQVKACIAS